MSYEWDDNIVEINNVLELSNATIRKLYKKSLTNAVNRIARIRSII